MPQSKTLLATLGGQAQVVTFALDWLLGRSEPIGEVVVLHLSPENHRVQHALSQLHVEFQDEQYHGHPCRFRPLALRHRDQILSDIQTEAAAEAVRVFVHDLISTLKRAGRSLHLSIAGGPRMLALMTLSSFILHCGHQDQVWHMHTEAHFLAQAQNGAILHDKSGDKVRLLQVPMVPWGAYVPALRQLNQTPATIMAAQTAWLNETERQRCRATWEQLKPRERDVLRLLANSSSPQDVAETLHLSPKTVDSHKTRIYAECRLAWGLPDAEWLDYHFLREKFGPFFATSAV